MIRLHSLKQFFIALCLILSGASLCPAAADVPRHREQRLIAALMFRITELVEWPGSSLGAPDEPLTVCLVGEDTTEGALHALAGKSLKNRQVRIEPIVAATVSRSCRVVYFGALASGETDRLLRALRNRPVLTVGESKDFAVSGGVVQMVRRTNTLAFHLNQEAVENAGLHLDGRLARLAAKVVSTR